MRRRVDPDAALPWACVATAGAWLTALALRHPAGDGDLLWQRWLGEKILHDGAIPRALGTETFSAPGAPWTPHEWLFSLALAASSDHGAPWLVPLLCALAATVAIATVVLRARRRGVPGVVATAAPVLCVIATLQAFGVRAQVLGWAGLGLLLWLLECEGPWAWAAVPLTVVWANLHASVFLAPVVATVFALAALARERAWTPAVRRSAGIAAACALATLATPLGAALPRYAVMLMVSPIRHSISEWQPVSIANASFVAGALPLLCIAVAFGVRASLRDRLLIGLFGVALFSAMRNVPVFALAVAPIALAALPRSAARRTHAAPAWLTLGAVTCAGALLAVLAWRSPASVADPRPAIAARAVPSTARVFCEDFAWCSLFLAQGRARVFLDGRCDPYPESVWRDYRDVLGGGARWAAILDARDVDAVLVRRDGALDGLLAERRPVWRALGEDRLSRLYVRTVSGSTPAPGRSASRRRAGTGRRSAAAFPGSG